MALTSTHTPSIICLSRQDLPQLAGSTIEKANHGGYVVLESPSPAAITLVSTGSEVSIVLESAKILADKGIAARVVSMPCFEVFDQQTREYQLSVFPDGMPILSVEAYTVSSPSLSSFRFWIGGGTDLVRFVWAIYRRWDGPSTRTSNTGSTLSERRRLSRRFTRSLESLVLVRLLCFSLPFLLLGRGRRLMV